MLLLAVPLALFAAPAALAGRARTLGARAASLGAPADAASRRHALVEGRRAVERCGVRPRAGERGRHRPDRRPRPGRARRAFASSNGFPGYASSRWRAVPRRSPASGAPATRGSATSSRSPSRSLRTSATTRSRTRSTRGRARRTSGSSTRSETDQALNLGRGDPSILVGVLDTGDHRGPRPGREDRRDVLGSGGDHLGRRCPRARDVRRLDHRLAQRRRPWARRVLRGLPARRLQGAAADQRPGRGRHPDV